MRKKKEKSKKTAQKTIDGWEEIAGFEMGSSNLKTTCSPPQKHKFEILPVQFYGINYVSGLQEICLRCGYIQWITDHNRLDGEVALYERKNKFKRTYLK